MDEKAARLAAEEEAKLAAQEDAKVAAEAAKLGMTAEEAKYWREKLETTQREQLQTVAKAATAWTALLTSLLGVFGLVSFAGGLTALNDLPAQWQPWVKGMVALAAVLVAWATVSAARASQTLSPVIREGDDVNKFKAEEEQRATKGLDLLGDVKWSASIAALVVLAGSLIVLVVGPASPPAQKFVAIVDGVATCGELQRQGEGFSIGTTTLDSGVTFMVVASCPPEPEG
jgi:hypothetical protein